MSVATQTLLALPVLVGFASYSIDLGWMDHVRGELQGAADATALAGSAYVGDPARVRAVAREVAARNTAGGRPVELADGDIHVGTWTDGTWTDDPGGAFVRVVAGSPEQPLFFAGVFGRAAFDPVATSTAQRPPPVGDYPCLMFADQAMQINGTAFIDGYDSSMGVYGATRDATASVCTNVRDVTIQGTADIEGDLHPGPGGRLIVQGAAFVSGSTEPLPERIELPPVSAPVHWNNHGVARTVHGDVDLPPGTYYFDNGLKVNGHGALRISGPTRIYLGADTSINGKGFVNTSADPTLLSIFVVGAHSLRLNGSADFYGGIYAPEASVKINGTARFYGAVVGRDLQANGTGDVHLDAALSGGDTPRASGISRPSTLVQ